MSAATLVLLAVKASIILTVVTVGLSATPRDAAYLFGRPGLLARSLLSMNVVAPLFAVALAAGFDLHPAVKIALVALAISPVPPILPRKGRRAGARASYVIGLLVATSVLAIVLVPLAGEILGLAFGVPLGLSAAEVARFVAGTTLAPLAVGIAVRAVAPAVAERMERPAALLATVLLITALLPVLVGAWPGMVALVGNGTVLAIAAFTVLALATGHLLGGPNTDERAALALATASRHPGVAIAIAGASFPGQKLAPAAFVLYLLVGAIVAVPYLAWARRRSHRPRSRSRSCA
jgi:BASS family bile acid:Na+ symporter